MSASEDKKHTHTSDAACSCGHDHKHSHEHHHTHSESCSCGRDHKHSHEHHHEHDHAHGASCSCGHDHEHEHHYGHEHVHTHPSAHSSSHADPGTAKSVFILENLGCAHCAAKMEAQIQNLPGVTYATITYATKQLRLSADHPDSLLPEIQKICASIESQVMVVPITSAAPKNAKKNADLNRQSDAAHFHICGKHLTENQKELAEIGIGTVLFIIGIILHMKGTESPAGLAVYVIGYLILGGKILLEAARNVSHGQIFDENFLMGIATLGAFGIQEYLEAMGVMLFYRIGEFFEHIAVERSRSQIMDAMDMRPETVNRITDGEVQIIPAENAVVGDLLLIRPGDRIPLDGAVTEGSSRLDTSPITGEPVPVAVKEGDKVTSGCINISGQLSMRVEKPLSESMVTRILDAVENAAASKPKLDRFITRFSRVYTPFVIAAALITAIVPSLMTGNWEYWVYTALTFLVISCPCALVLSVPLAFFSGIGAGSKKGILFKGGVSIEALSRLKAVVMDKTGTITQGNFRLQKIVSAGILSEEELLRICAGCEQNSTHPIAHSIVAAAEARGIRLTAPFSMEEIAGCGIAASTPEGQILCGNLKLMERYHISVEKLPESAYGAEVFLSVSGTFAGYFLISDTIKTDAASAVSRLKSLGLYTGMLTGDSADSAKAVAAATGIDEVHAKLLPQDKLSILTGIRAQHGAVMFVGDGINDAPVLAGADVGAAMGSGADAAIEAADAVFMTSSVESIPDAIVIARRTNRIAVQNVVFALIIKAAVMILGLCGLANMWMAVFADSGVAMLCVLNSIRILYQKTQTN